MAYLWRTGHLVYPVSLPQQLNLPVNHSVGVQKKCDKKTDNLRLMSVAIEPTPPTIIKKLKDVQL
jgi:hypothetical protein